MSALGNGKTPQVDRPTLSRPNERLRVAYQDTEFEVALSENVTGGKFFLTRYRHLLANSAPPLHMHTREEEVWFIHKGVFRFWVHEDPEVSPTTFDASAGDVVYGPRNIAHTFQSVDGPGDVSVLLTPAASEEYFMNIGHHLQRDDASHLAELKRVGIEVLGPAPSA